MTVMNKKMHILIIPSEHFITTKAPHASIFQYEQCKLLSNNGHRVGVLSVGFISLRNLGHDYPYQRVECHRTFSIWRLYKRALAVQRLLPIGVNKWRYLRIFKKFYREYERSQGRPDIVHAHNFVYAGFLAEWLWNSYKIPFILTDHSSAFARGLISHRANPKIASVIRRAGVVTCVSSSQKQILANRFNQNFDLLPNVVAPRFFETRIDTTKENQIFTFLTIGRLVDNKNQQLLLRAFALNFKGSATQLKIAGEGPMKLSLRNLSKELGISHQVEFLGSLTRAEVNSEMLKAHCFVLPSRYETFGVVLIEALASGLPLVATRCGGPQDIIDDTNGILVESENLTEFGSAMLEIKQTFYKFDAVALRERAAFRFGPDAFVKRLLEYYEKAIRNARYR